MPDREGVTSLIKVADTERAGVPVVLHGRGDDEAVAVALRTCSAAGASLLPPFAAPGAITGRGATAREG